MTQDRVSPERPDARLVRLHAERGDPHTRLAGALADLEGAAWGLLLADARALAAQLAALVGRGTLRVDPRVRVDRDALAGAGLAAASLDADWRGAQAVWLMDPAAEELDRARRAGVRVIVDATLAPGGDWPSRGAALVTYRDSATLTGYGDAPLAALFGPGRAPEPAGAAPSDLSVALALRDVATLPLRLARAARTAAALAERLGGAVQSAGPTALLLAPDAVSDTAAPLGGVQLAARSVTGGVLLTPGLEDLSAVLARVGPAQSQEAGQSQDTAQSQASQPQTTPAQTTQAQDTRRDGRLDAEREGSGAERRDLRVGRRDRQDRGREFRRGDRPGRPDSPGPDRPDSSRPARSEERPRRDEQSRRHEAPGNEAAQTPQRFTFEAPEPARNLTLEPWPADSVAPAAASEEVWEPEIVFSDSPAPAPAPLPIPVSGGPDAPDQPAGLPDVQHLGSGAELSAGEISPEAATEELPTPDAAPAADPTPEPTPVILPPDLPGGKEDPAAGLTDEQAAVYARLREWRNAEAKRQEISRFIIASNATLAEIARRVPYTEADLKAVRGMGPERLRKYGEKILEVVRG